LNFENSISVVKFNPIGDYLAVAVSYDWSLGYESGERKLINTLEIQNVDPKDITPKFMKKKDLDDE
jgi:hypothetical protein